MEHETEVILLVISSSVIFMLLGSFIVIFIMSYQKQKRVHQQEKTILKAAFEQEILTSQIEVQNTTLQHIGQELHDNIGQLLSVARINLNIIEESDPADDNRAFVKQANELISLSINALRALTKSLDGDFVQDFGLNDSIAQELQRIRHTRKFGTELQVSGKPYTLGFQREIVLFRIVQELLNNALKHAEATQLTIRLHYTPDLFELTVMDDGKGFDYQAAKENNMNQSGAGLRNIQRRVALIGGTCEFVSAVGNGTKVRITVPNQAV